MGAVHLAHPAGAKRRHDVVLAESIAGGQAGRGRAGRIACGGDDAQCGQQRLGCGRPLCRERPGGVVGREQRFDIAAQCFIARDRSRDEGGSLGRRLFDRGFEQASDAQPAVFGHERRRGDRAVTVHGLTPRDPSSFASQALAVRQSRFAVDGDTFRTCAASSMVSPANARNSTSCARPGSSCSSRPSA